MEAPEEKAGTDELREALLDQLAYLATEADALQSVIGLVPEPVLEAHPLSDQLSVKELYGLLLRLDEAVYEPFAREMINGSQPCLQETPRRDVLGDESWNQRPIEEILIRLAGARRRLVSLCRSAPQEMWQETGTMGNQTLDLYALSYGIIQQDVEILRELGERLHDARLSGPSRHSPL